ncbi:MAG: hypothetical protein QOG53_1087 [Frankiales bacterium]|jgi:hypothetical protein|nr:hypothetical protein [Frankiales bacterium]
MRKAALIVLASIALTAITGFRGTASADFGPVLNVPLASAIAVGPPDNQQPVVAVQLALVAGEARHVWGHLVATSSITGNARQTAILQCRVNQTTARVGTPSRVTTSQNHEGRDTQYTPTPGELAVDADFLFVAPATALYTCEMLMDVGASSAAYHLTAVPLKTWIKVSTVSQRGARMLYNAPCGSTGTDPTCVYLTGNEQRVVVLANGSAQPNWAADPAARSLDVVADLSLTNCGAGTASCVRAKWGRDDVAAAVDAYLEVIQLDPAGRACGPVARTPGPGAGRRIYISFNAHHSIKRFQIQRVPVRPECGTRLFTTRIRITHVGGNPVKVGGYVPSLTTAQTAGIFMNRFGL